MIKLNCEYTEDAYKKTKRKNSFMWQVEVHKFVKNFGLTHEDGIRSRKEDWWGVLYPDCTVAPYGLAHYMWLTFSKKLFIKSIWSNKDWQSFPLPMNVPEELANTDFKDWIRSKSFYKNAQETLNSQALYRPKDIEKIREYRLKK